jgi:dynein heavy chain
MTSLFVKITNQMITSCKEFVYKGGEAKIWDLNRTVLVQRLMECMKLNEAYQRCFHEIKKKLQETPNEKQFDFSEMYIFGKFDAFCKRIQKVIEMFSIIEKFALLETLGVEGMDVIVRRFTNILTQMQRKPYDILDHRKLEYDADFNNFKKQVADQEASVQAFIDSSFEHITSTEQSLNLLSKFSLIKDMQLDLETKYHVVFVHFTRKDLEGVRKLYQKCKDNPSISRNTPVVSGSIAWARQLYRRIEEPMKQFKNFSHVLESIDAKKHIRNYNKLARALIEYEMLWSRSWFNIVESAKTGLQATLLVASADHNLIYVNFDPQITQLIKETKNMERLGLEVPGLVRSVCQKELYYKGLYNSLVLILQQKKSILARVSSIMVKAMAPHIDELDRNLQPGLTALTWTSLNLDNYLDANNRQLFKLSELVDRLLDISECRVGAGVRKIAEMSLIEVPAENEQCNVEFFLEKTEKRCANTLQIITNRSNLVETAARDIIAELSKNVTQYVTPELRIAYEAVYFNANYQNFEVFDYLL